jgi:hypothetical protein
MPRTVTARRTVRRAEPDAADQLIDGATKIAAQAGMSDALALAADSIGFAQDDVSDRG